MSDRESNYYVEKDLIPQHTPSLCPNPGPIFTRRLSEWPRLHMHSSSTNSPRTPSPYIHMFKSMCILRITHVQPHETAFEHSCIPGILHIVSLLPTGHTSQYRCVAAKPLQSLCMGLQKVPSPSRVEAHTFYINVPPP